MHRPATTSLRFLRLAALLGLYGLGITTDTHAHGGLHERIAVLGEKIAAKPETPDLHFELADVYCQHEQWKEALTEIEKTEELAPGKFPTALLRGQVAFGFGHWEEARAQLDLFLEQVPGHANAHLYRARALMKSGRIDEALTGYRDAFRFNKSPDPDFVNEVADVLAGRGEREEALQVLDKSIGQLGPVPSLQTRALELDLAADRFESALARVEILKKNAVRPEVWMAREASILHRAGRAEEARATWTELISRIEKLPNLQRGSQQIRRLETEARAALSALARDPSPLVNAEARSR